VCLAILPATPAMNWKFVLILTCLAVCLPLLAAPDGGPLELENGVSFRLEERRGWLAGLGGFAVDGYPLSAPDSLVFPLVADEWAEKPQIAAGLKLREARPVDGGWDLHLELYGAGEPADWAAWFARDAEEGAVVRDKFRFPRIRPLAEITRRAHRADYLDARGGELRRMGELVWRIRPHADVIAGWPWKGWQWRFDLELDAPHQATALRLLGGWEAGGTLQGLTLANQRYRGLGDLEQAIATDADGRATTSFNTQDIPLDAQTAAASAQLDREAALALREESWIHVMARGAGTGYFDFQYNSRAALLAHPQRQGNLRALTEVYPGDGGVGQLSEAHFARARRWSGEAMHYAALVMAAPRSAEFWRTRHLEIDRELRARVGAELGFQADLAVPTVGYLFDFWGATDRFAPLVARMANYAGRLAALGVERVMVSRRRGEQRLRLAAAAERRAALAGPEPDLRRPRDRLLLVDHRHVAPRRGLRRLCRPRPRQLGAQLARRSAQRDLRGEHAQAQHPVAALPRGVRRAPG